MNTDLNIEAVRADINRFAEEGKDISRVNRYFNREIGYSKNYANKFFREKYSMTIDEYFKMQKLRRAYSLWVQEGQPSFSEKAEYHGIKYFKRKFKKAFRLYPEEAYEMKLDINTFSPFQEMQQFLLLLISLPAFMVKKKVWENLHGFENSKNEEMSALVAMTILNWFDPQATLSNINANGFTFPMDYTCQLNMPVVFNIKEPYEAYDKVVFAPVIQDDFYAFFCDEVDKIMPGLSIYVFELDDDFMWKFARWQSGLLSEAEKNIESLADYCGADVKETTELLWGRIKTGFIRYMPGRTTCRFI